MAPNNNVNPSRVVDTQTGRQTKPWIVSKSFGRYRGPLIQTISITREQSVELIPEFDNPNMATSVRTYDGSKATIEWVASQNQAVEAMLMNTNPLYSPLMYDPAQLAPVDVIAVDYGKNSATNYASRLLIYGQQDSSAINEDTKSAMKKTVGLSFIAEKEIINGQIQYTRFTKGSVPFVTADDVAFDVNGVGTFQTTTKLVNNTDGTTTRLLYVKQNGAPQPDTTTWSATATTFTPTTAPTAGDTWECFTVIASAAP